MPRSVRSNSRTANASAVRTTASHISNAVPQRAQTAGQWLSVRSVFSGASRHLPLAPGCLPGLRPDGGGAFARGGAAPPPGPPSLRPTPQPGGSPSAPKGGSDDGGRELLVEFSAKRSLNSTARVGKTASQLDKLRRFQRLEYGAVQSAQVKLVFGSHVPSESQM